MSNNNISIAMKAEMQEVLARHAKDRGVSRSKYVCDLLGPYLGDEDTLPVVLKIPDAVRKDRTALRRWLLSKNELIINSLCKGESAHTRTDTNTVHA